MPEQESTLENVQRIIAVSSCKGGVGKSTVAAYLARALANRPLRVGLLDSDLYGPSIPTLFNLLHAPVTLNANKLFVPIEQEGLKLMSLGFVLGDNPAVMRGPMVTNYIHRILHQTDWGELDYLLIDMPPGTGDIQLTLTQSARLNGAVIVTTPHTLSLIDVARGILMFEKVNVPILGVVENMAYFVCDDCGKHHDIFGSYASRSLEGRFGIETLAQWPLMSSLIQPIDQTVARSILIQETADRLVTVLEKKSLAQPEIPVTTFDAAYVILSWTDGRQVRVSNRDLRLSCSCALCLEDARSKKTLQERKIRPDIAPRLITPLGNYAVNITWNDGHSSGIYPYQNIIEEAKKWARGKE